MFKTWKIWLILVVIIAGGIYYYLNLGQSETIIDVPTQEAVNNYLRLKINDLSPEKAVMGGRFYVTELELTEPGKGVVSFEDGHIALTALFSYQISGEKVDISSFELLPNR